MSRGKQILLLVAALGAVAGVVYWALRSRPLRGPAAEALPGLAWLPAESGLVAGVNLTAVRQQPWLVEMLRAVAGEQKETPDYRAFVEATGFDYTRDLDRVWLGVYGASDRPTVVGVAEGRFARDKILAHTRAHGARVRLEPGVEIYEVQARTQPAGSFAFAFLDDTHVGFGSDAGAAAQVVACWQGRAPAVAAQAGHRAELERLAAGRHLWVVDELARWQPTFLQAQRDLQPVLSVLAAGFEVNEQGVTLTAEARCREPQQAQRLFDNLRIGALAGRLALARRPDQASQAVGEALGNLTFTREGDALRARVLLPPEMVATFLGLPADASRPSAQTTPQPAK